ncbi:hypothetical protein ACHAXS_000233 [Conticribra weissflogii]
MKVVTFLIAVVTVVVMNAADSNAESQSNSGGLRKMKKDTWNYTSGKSGKSSSKSSKSSSKSGKSGSSKSGKSGSSKSGKSEHSSSSSWWSGDVGYHYYHGYSMSMDVISHIDYDDYYPKEKDEYYSK